MAPDVGDMLREARERRGLELDDVERVTKIRVRHLRAMEEDRWDLLPGSAYARGFLRTYATCVGLDSAALMHEYRRRHEPPDEGYPDDEPLLLKAPGSGRPRLAPIGVILAGLVAVALGIVVVLGLTGGSPTINRHGGAGPGAGAQAQPKTTSTAGSSPHPSAVSLRLRSTGSVWVCLVDDRGRPLVNGLTLAAGEARGPFRARAFKLTLGNGAVQMDVDGNPVGIPQLAEPLGYQVTTQGVRQLAPAARPTCA
jgi:cytoskeletal protein RodZ